MFPISSSFSRLLCYLGSLWFHTNFGIPVAPPIPGKGYGSGHYGQLHQLGAVSVKTVRVLGAKTVNTHGGETCWGSPALLFPVGRCSSEGIPFDTSCSGLEDRPMQMKLSRGKCCSCQGGHEYSRCKREMVQFSFSDLGRVASPARSSGHTSP